jgi:glycerol-3-phosphate dehydrogenase (NAD(P)+)
MKMTVAVLGAGAWGTALAHLFAHNGHSVKLWCYEAEVADTINRSHQNPLFLKEVMLPSTVQATADINMALDDVEIVVEAIPVIYLRDTLNTIADTQKAARLCWVLTSKGLEAKTGKHSVDILYELYGNKVSVAVVAGPSFATELVQKMPTMCMAACATKEQFLVVQELWKNGFCKLLHTDDMDGLLLCGVVKNVLALLLGMLDGAGYGKNTQALLLTYAFAELKKLVKFAGGQAATVDGLGGFGDLFLTASTNVSKNRTYGCLIGAGKTDDEIKKVMPVLPEGVGSAQGLYAFLKAKCALKKLLLLTGVKDLVDKKITIQQYVDSFLSTIN